VLYKIVGLLKMLNDLVEALKRTIFSKPNGHRRVLAAFAFDGECVDPGNKR